MGQENSLSRAPRQGQRVENLPRQLNFQMNLIILIAAPLQNEVIFSSIPNRDPDHYTNLVTLRLTSLHYNHYTPGIVINQGRGKSNMRGMR